MWLYLGIMRKDIYELVEYYQSEVDNLHEELSFFNEKGDTRIEMLIIAYEGIINKLTLLLIK